MENDKSKKNGNVLKLGIIVAVIVVLAIIVAVVMSNKKVVTQNSNTAEIKEKLNIEINEPESAEEVVYDIENDSIAKISYAKKLPSGEEMHFVLRSSYAKEEDLENFGYNVGFEDAIAIMMSSVCNDGAEIEVESYVAVDENGRMKYMKALWMDNDKYYSMITDDLVTREDFLQEVNRVIIDNHIDFVDDVNASLDE